MKIKHVNEDKTVVESKVLINKKHLFLSYSRLHEENKRTITSFAFDVFKLSSATSYMGAFWEDSNTKKPVKFRIKITNRKVNMLLWKFIISFKIR